MSRTPLYDRHVALGAKMVDFAGWEMPIQYRGILAEHRRCRAVAGLFDVSHMGEFALEGPGGLAFLQRALTNDYGTLAVGRCRYSLLCNEAGGILDDLIVYRRADERWLLIVNAANIAADFAWLDALGHPDAELRDVSAAHGLIALQGPRSLDLLALLLSATEAERLRALHYYAFGAFKLPGAPVLISRTGYTGDRGVELLAPTAATPALWDLLLSAGAEAGLVPVGLGARDTLRLEAGFCLHGHDISPARDPLSAGLERFVALGKGDFVGREALARIAAAGPRERLVGLLPEGRAPVRDGAALTVGGEPVGVVTSGSFSPSLDRPIALAYVRADLAAPGTMVEAEVRGKAITCAVASLPFYRPPRVS